MLLEPTCIIRKSICFKLTVPLATRLDSLPIVAPGNACTEHPLISVTYLGIEAERIVPIFLLKTPGNIYKYKHLNI